MTLNVIGVGNVPINNKEYTTADIITPYTQYITDLQRILNKVHAAGGAASPLTPQDYQDLINDVTQLKNLAQKGAKSTLVPNDTTIYYLTSSMASSLGLLLNSLSVAGVLDANGNVPNPALNMSNPADVTTALNGIATWQNLASLGVSSLITQALTAASTGGHSLQSMIELSYVQEGNLFISQNLSAMESQVSMTNHVLNNLTIIQNVINQISVQPASNFAFPPTLTSQIPSSIYTILGSYNPDILTDLKSDAASAMTIMKNYNASNPAVKMTYTSALNLTQNKAATQIQINVGSGQVTNYELYYKTIASAHFTQVFPVANPLMGTATTQGSYSTLLNAFNSLRNDIATMKTTTPVAGTSAGSLLVFLQQVTNDISSHIINIAPTIGISLPSTQYLAVSSYILDNQSQKLSSSQGFKAGAIQTNVTNATSAAESLNQQQQAALNNYEFIFQQFYTSASDTLSQIDQIIEQQAQAIAKQ